MLASQMNFEAESVDPRALGTRRSRGSSWSKPNYTFPAILGRVHRREDPFCIYLGDTTQTYTR